MSGPVSPADTIGPPLRTPSQLEWIRTRYNPEALRRLAANRDYADSHGGYLPDVAALAYAEWERAEGLLAVGERDKAEIERLGRALVESNELRRVQRYSHDALSRQNGELANAAERDGRQIAQLTEQNDWLLKQIDGCIESAEALATTGMSLARALAGDLRDARAVLAGEEDAGNG